jgi:hypothetical protein
VEPSREQLTQRLQEVSDAELLRHVRERTLIPAALEVAEQIIQARGLAQSSAGVDMDSAVETSVEPDEPAAGDLVPLVEFLGPQKAGVLRTCLESHGIFVHLWGEHLAYMDIILSAATGRTKLLVPATQLAQAREILAAFTRGELEAPPEVQGAPGAPRGSGSSEPQQQAEEDSPRRPHPMSREGWMGRLFLGGLRVYLVLVLGWVLVFLIYIATIVYNAIGDR